MFRKLAMICVLLCCGVSSAWGLSLQKMPGGILSSNPWGDVLYIQPECKISQTALSPSNSADSVRISAARNEYEPFQLVVVPKKTLKNVNVIPRTLVGPKAAKIPAWNISVRKVESVQLAERLEIPEGYALLIDNNAADPLPDLQPFTAPSGQRSAAWVTVYVPDKTPAGDYSGTIDITADGGIKTSIKLKLHVWDFTLPTVSRLRTAFGCSFDNPVKFHGAKTLDEKRKLVELYNKDFWRHRVSPMKPYEFHDIKIARAGESLKLDFSEFDKAVSKYFPLFNSFALPGFEAGNDFGLNLGDDYERLKIEYMRAVAEHAANKGQIAKAYAIYDSREADLIAEQADLCSKADERIKVLWTAGRVEPKALGSVSIWGIYDPSFQQMNSISKLPKGNEAWLHVPANAGPDSGYACYAVDSNGHPYRFGPWIAWANGMTGMVISETTDWGEKPYEQAMQLANYPDTHWGKGKGGLLYPPVKTPAAKFIEKGPVPSIRWELIREGIEDYDYFVILKDRMEKTQKTNPSDPAVVKAEEALRMVQERGGRAPFSYDFMAVRTKVAQAIEALK